MLSKNTSSFVLTLKLNTNKQDERILARRFSYAKNMQNLLVRHCKKQITSLRQNSLYRELIAAYHRDKKDKSVKLALKLLIESYGLTLYQLEAFIKTQQHKYSQYIDSHVSQKIAKRVYHGVEKVLYQEGKRLHFKRYDEYESVEGKNNIAGIKFRFGKLEWLGLCIQTQFDKSDLYECEALKSKVKYCRIVRKPIGTKYHYYVQLVLEGIPPIKHIYGNGDCGIDIGPSSVAVVSHQWCLLEPLSQATTDQKKIRRLQRKMDRSRRATNPDNYNEDGTTKKHKRFYKSKSYKKTAFRLAGYRKKQAAATKQYHNQLANMILEHGTNVIVEQMSFKGLQRKAKNTTKTANGRNKRKKRFGKSIENNAPSALIETINQKLGYIGLKMHKVDTISFKASQYNHITDDYYKKKLSKRWNNNMNGYKIQRDLYSAFLLMNSNDTYTHADRKKCLATFEEFVKQHNICIAELSTRQTKLPKCMGL